MEGTAIRRESACEVLIAEVGSEHLLYIVAGRLDDGARASKDIVSQKLLLGYSLDSLVGNEIRCLSFSG